MKSYWIAGHSGSGKTTVAKILHGIDLDRFGHWEDKDGKKLNYNPGKMKDTDQWIVPPEKIPIGKYKLFAGSMNNFDEVKNLPWAGRIWLKVTNPEREKRLVSPSRDNPFGKDPKERELALRAPVLPGDPDSWIIIDADKPIKSVVADVRSIISSDLGESEQILSDKEVDLDE
jgi:energy-coupling factor transporter ATP-binding protein EcfA2